MDNGINSYTRYDGGIADSIWRIGNDAIMGKPINSEESDLPRN
jgi:hypothetical protein